MLEVLEIRHKDVWHGWYRTYWQFYEQIFLIYLKFIEDNDDPEKLPQVNSNFGIT